MSAWEFKEKARPRGSCAVQTEDREAQSWSGLDLQLPL
jgi:hypothetical protein